MHFIIGVNFSKIKTVSKKTTLILHKLVEQFCYPSIDISYQIFDENGNLFMLSYISLDSAFRHYKCYIITMILYYQILQNNGSNRQETCNLDPLGKIMVI